MDAENYILELLDEEAELQRIRQRTEAAGMPAISIKPVYGRLLTLLVAASGARDVLEIGALGGYGAACLARGLISGGRVLTLEIDAAHARAAEQNLAEAGLEDRVEIRQGDARESLRALEEEGRRFDFFFVDADKESYPQYLESCLRLARPGALLAADNALFHGRVVDPQDGTEAARALRAFNRAVMSDPRLTAVILPAYDGLALARVSAGQGF